MGLLLGQVSKWRAQRADGGAHAARGFVGGAAGKLRYRQILEGGFNAARGFVGGAADKNTSKKTGPELVSMPHAALWVVQRGHYHGKFFCCRVSMPHAALWVVQPPCCASADA